MAHNSADAGMVSVESLEALSDYWQDPGNRLDWDCLFSLPPWLTAWWESFGAGLSQHICAVRLEGELIGLAPLTIHGDTARIMGDGRVFDYMDFVVAPGHETRFFKLLFAHIKEKGVSRLELGRVRADSRVISRLATDAGRLGCRVLFKEDALLYQIDLPGSWDEFLRMLSAKQRHEVRRKLKRLHEAGRIALRVVEGHEQIDTAMDMFVKLFRMNRPDKAAFMTDKMEIFFRSLARSTAGAGLLRLFFLNLDDKPAAAAMCFDYGSMVYLYNNAYDAQYRPLSAALVCKVMSIRDSIERGRKRYSLLKGDESYKRRLGGMPLDLLRCEVMIR